MKKFISLACAAALTAFCAPSDWYSPTGSTTVQNSAIIQYINSDGELVEIEVEVDGSGALNIPESVFESMTAEQNNALLALQNALLAKNEVETLAERLDSLTQNGIEITANDPNGNPIKQTIRFSVGLNADGNTIAGTSDANYRGLADDRTIAFGTGELPSLNLYGSEFLNAAHKGVMPYWAGGALGWNVPSEWGDGKSIDTKISDDGTLKGGISLAGFAGKDYLTLYNLADYMTNKTEAAEEKGRLSVLVRDGSLTGTQLRYADIGEIAPQSLDGVSLNYDDKGVLQLYDFHNPITHSGASENDRVLVKCINNKLRYVTLREVRQGKVSVCDDYSVTTNGIKDAKIAIVGFQEAPHNTIPLKDDNGYVTWKPINELFRSSSISYDSTSGMFSLAGTASGALFVSGSGADQNLAYKTYDDNFFDASADKITFAGWNKLVVGGVLYDLAHYLTNGVNQAQGDKMKSSKILLLDESAPKGELRTIDVGMIDTKMKAAEPLAVDDEGNVSVAGWDDPLFIEEDLAYYMTNDVDSACVIMVQDKLDPTEIKYLEIGALLDSKPKADEQSVSFSSIEEGGDSVLSVVGYHEANAAAVEDNIAYVPVANGESNLMWTPFDEFFSSSIFKRTSSGKISLNGVTESGRASVVTITGNDDDMEIRAKEFDQKYFADTGDYISLVGFKALTRGTVDHDLAYYLTNGVPEVVDGGEDVADGGEESDPMSNCKVVLIDKNKDELKSISVGKLLGDEYTHMTADGVSTETNENNVVSLRGFSTAENGSVVIKGTDQIEYLKSNAANTYLGYSSIPGVLGFWPMPQFNISGSGLIAVTDNVVSLRPPEVPSIIVNDDGTAKYYPASDAGEVSGDDHSIELSGSQISIMNWMSASGATGEEYDLSDLLYGGGPEGDHTFLARGPNKYACFFKVGDTIKENRLKNAEGTGAVEVTADLSNELSVTNVVVRLAEYNSEDEHEINSFVYGVDADGNFLREGIDFSDEANTDVIWGMIDGYDISGKVESWWRDAWTWDVITNKLDGTYCHAEDCQKLAQAVVAVSNRVDEVENAVANMEQEIGFIDSDVQHLDQRLSEAEDITGRLTVGADGALYFDGRRLKFADE